MAQSSGCARAIYDYEARASDELSFKRHDIIEVLGQDEEDDGWYIGVLNGKKGLFPNNYVQFQEAAAKVEPPVAKQPAPTAAPAPKGAPTLPDYVQTTTFEKSYTLAETLGRGRFSQVRRCTQIPGGRSCAVKIMDLEDPELGASPADAEREVIAEVEVLRLVQHSGVVQLYQTFKNKQFYYLVLEDLGGGDLFDRIEQNGPFKEEDAAPLIRQASAPPRPAPGPCLRRPPLKSSVCVCSCVCLCCARQVVSAIAFLHEKGIVHRDLKPDNLVFDGRAHDAAIKLIDFGYAGHCSEQQPLKGLCGTPDYAAPEILTWYSIDKSKKPSGTPYGHAVDMWSLGVVLYILLCGFPPFYGDDDEQMFELIRAGSYSFPESIDGYKTTWGTVSEGAKALVRGCLTVQPAQRMSAPSVLAGEWLASLGSQRGGWIGKMRERSNSGWRAAAKPDGKGGQVEQPRLDRGQIDRGEPALPSQAVNTDAKMVFGDENYEGKLKYSLQQGGLVSQFSRWIVDRIVKREMRILMLGLDNSGKTSILYRLKLGQPKRTVPTIGFNVETLEYKNIAFTVWDVGGQEKLRALWRHYFASTQALIFVVDSSDRARLHEAAEELHRLIKEEELSNALLLVLANKQDLPGACNAAELAEEMHLYPPYISKSCYIQSCCATSGEGLHEGLDWLSSNMPDSEEAKQ